MRPVSLPVSCSSDYFSSSSLVSFGRHRPLAMLAVILLAFCVSAPNLANAPQQDTSNVSAPTASPVGQGTLAAGMTQPLTATAALAPAAARALPPVTANSNHLPLAPSVTLLDEVGLLRHPVTPSQVAAWKQELNPQELTTPQPSDSTLAPTRAALLHLWLGEWELASNQQPERARWHFRMTQQLAHQAASVVPLTDANRLAARRLYGLADYDSAIALFYRGAYGVSADAFSRLLALKTMQPGYDRRTCAHWYKHVLACANYHRERAAQSIPEPPQLDPQCGAAALAACLRGLHQPYDKATVLAACRVTGEGSSLQDVLDAAKKLHTSARTVTADDAGLLALPKPLVAFVEGDHFISVVGADKAGVSYLCSDCGMWPGGRVHLTWKQWHLLNPGLYAVVTAPSSVWEKTLAALTPAPSHGNLLRLASAGRLSGLGVVHENALLPNLATLRQHVRYIDHVNGTCGYKPTTQQCPPYYLCCWDCYEHSLNGGPSDGDPVNLATGEEEYQPAPDLTVYNPVGPSVIWGRMYNSLRGPNIDVQTPDGTYPVQADSYYGLGWSDSYNSIVTDPTYGTHTGNYINATPFTSSESGYRYLVLPNGARVKFTVPDLPTVGTNNNGNGYLPSTGSSLCFSPGAPYQLQWNYQVSAHQSLYNNQYFDYVYTTINYIVTYPDRTQWIYGLYGGSIGLGDYYKTLTRIQDRNGNGINFGADANHNDIITNDASPARTLLTIYRDPAYGTINRIQDYYGRNVFYSTDRLQIGTTNTYVFDLTHASQVTNVTTNTPPAVPDRYAYGYSDDHNESGETFPFLGTITVPSPMGPVPATYSLYAGETGTSTATINYDDSNYGCFVSSLVDGNGNTRTYMPVNGANATTVSVTDTSGHTVTTTSGFDNNMSQTTRTDAATPSHTVSTSQYSDPNAPYRPTVVTDALGRITTYTWDQFGNLHQMTSPRGTVTNFTYGFPASTYAVVGPSGADVVNTQPKSDAFGLGELLGTQEGSKAATTYMYNEPSGLVQSITTPPPGGTGSPVTTTYGYDLTTSKLGNLLTISTPGNNSATSISTTYDYGSSPAIGQPLTEKDNLSHQITFSYDNQGNRTSKSDANNNTTTFAYNVANQLTQTIYPATVLGYAAYDANSYLYPGGPMTGMTTLGESSTATRPLLRQVNYGYGPEGETVSVTGSAEPVSYTYDALYRLKTLTDGGGHVTSYFYNGAGYLKQIAYPRSTPSTPPLSPLTAGSSDTVTFNTYDLNGNVLTRVDGNGVTTTYTYDDPESLLTLIHYSTNSTGDVAFHYDAYGRRAQMSDSVSGSTTRSNTDKSLTSPGVSYTYDDDDNPLTVTTTYTGPSGTLPPRTLTYGYYPDGSRASLSVNGLPTPSGQPAPFTYGYDAAGRQNSLTNPYGETSTWAYNNNNWLASQTLHNGQLYSNYTYNPRGFLTVEETRVIDGTGGQNLLAYYGGGGNPPMTYDGLGNRTQVYRSIANGNSASFQYLPYSGIVSYQYDNGQPGTVAGAGRSQLTGEQFAATPSPYGGGSNYSNPYAYDGVSLNDGGSLTGAGNPTSFENASHTFNRDNQLSDTGGGFSYDGNGNPVSYKNKTLTFDPENRLIQYGVPNTGGPYMAADYNGDGLRAQKTNNSGTSFFLYDGDQPVVKLGTSTGPSYGAITLVSTFGANGLVSRSSISGSTVTPTFYSFDPQGGVSHRTDSNGALVTADEYDAFGNRQSINANLTVSTNSDPASFGAQWGYMTDWEDGLVLCGHRYYDPSNGRWLTRDPIGYDGGVNLYGYCENNSVNKSDRLGLSVYLCQQYPIPTLHFPCGLISPGGHIHSWLVCKQGDKTTTLGLYPTTSMWGGLGQWGGTNFPDNDEQSYEMKDSSTTCEQIKLTPSQEACLCKLINHPPAPPTYSIVPGCGTMCFNEAVALIEKCTSPWFWRTGPTKTATHL